MVAVLSMTIGDVTFIRTSPTTQKQADFILYQDRDVLLLEEIGVHGQIHRSAVLYFKWEI
jgi:hypothetical protein